MVHGPARLHFVGNKLIAAIEKQNAKLFAVLESHRGAQIGEHGGHCRQHGPLLDFALGRPETSGLHNLDFGHNRVSDTFDLQETFRGRGHGFGEAAKPGKDLLGERLYVPARDSPEQDQFQKLIIGKRLSPAFPEPLPKTITMAPIMRNWPRWLHGRKTGARFHRKQFEQGALFKAIRHWKPELNTTRHQQWKITPPSTHRISTIAKKRKLELSGIVWLV